MSEPRNLRLHAVTLLVDDYDEAIAHYVGDLGFTLLEDTPLEAGKRWVRVSPDPEGQTALLLAVASTESQRSAVGCQTGGRVVFRDRYGNRWDLIQPSGSP